MQKSSYNRGSQYAHRIATRKLYAIAIIAIVLVLLLLSVLLSTLPDELGSGGCTQKDLACMWCLPKAIGA